MAESELLELTQQLLYSIDQQDWQVYTRLCDSTLSAFEPEALGNLVEGMEFHEFFIDNIKLQLFSFVRYHIILSCLW